MPLSAVHSGHHGNYQVTLFRQYPSREQSPQAPSRGALSVLLGDKR